MGNEGLFLSVNEFNKLPTSSKLTCLYENQVAQMTLIKGYKLYYKLTSVLGGLLFAGVSALLGLYLKLVGG